MDSTFELGAEPVSSTQTNFSVWAPNAKSLNVQLFSRVGDDETFVSTHELAAGEGDIFSGLVDCGPGALYRFQLNNGDARPDPRSKFQPFGVHGPSEVIDKNAFKWTDHNWKGVAKRDLVIYELHVGSLTEKGDYASAIEKFDEWKRLGITAIELLPLAQCPGKWNWGYDGVNYFAPTNNFGRPDDLKNFIDACHQNGFAVIIDVVYNHVGPEGNYLSVFGPYRSKKFGTPWGDAFDFDQTQVRKFVIDNVLFWLDEYHFDGLRLDAVHYMFDDASPHILEDVRESFKRFSEDSDRELHLIGESNIYDPELVGDVANSKPNFDAIWSDCLMHSIYKLGNPELRLTNRQYNVTDISETLEHAYVFSTPNAIRVTPNIRENNHQPVDPNKKYVESLIMALQTHDSVGNHPHGKRLHQLMTVDFQKSAAALVLLYSSIPMIFMGEEWATEAPFPFFADFEDDRLRKAVDEGRRDEYPHHNWEGSPLPSDPAAFLNSKLNPKIQNPEVFDWYCELLALRRQGVSEGWLNIESRRVETDLESSVFQLHFQRTDGTLTVCCRLGQDNDDPIELSSLNPGNILLDSKKTSQNLLDSQHCLIWLK